MNLKRLLRRCNQKGEMRCDKYMKGQLTYTIKKIQKDDSNQVAMFMQELLNELFPMMNHEQLPFDILHLNNHYIDRDDAALFAAMDEAGTVLGTIGYLPYDGRFDQLEHVYKHMNTTELVRCYISERYRRMGIGSALYETVIKSIRHAGYEKVYLHTHPFLPGGLSFWKTKGFIECLREEDPVWQTLHMDKDV